MKTQSLKGKTAIPQPATVNQPPTVSLSKSSINDGWNAFHEASLLVNTPKDLRTR